MKDPNKLTISAGKIYLFKSVSGDGIEIQGVYFTADPHWEVNEMVECMRLLGSDDYGAGLYTYKVRKNGSIKLKQVMRAMNLEPRTGEFVITGLRGPQGPRGFQGSKGDKGNPGYELPTEYFGRDMREFMPVMHHSEKAPIVPDQCPDQPLDKPDELIPTILRRLDKLDERIDLCDKRASSITGIIADIYSRIGDSNDDGVGTDNPRI